MSPPTNDKLSSSARIPRILPLTAQEISGYKLVNGADEAVDTLEALDPVPRVLAWLDLH